MKVIDKLPNIDFEKLVNSPIEYLLDIWEFIVVFYTVVNGLNDKQIVDKVKRSYFDIHKVRIIEDTEPDKYGPKKDYDGLKEEEERRKRWIDKYNEYIKINFEKYKKDIPKEGLKKYLRKYIDLYSKEKLYGKKTNYKNFANSQEVVYKTIQEFQAKYGNCIVIPVPYDTQEEKEVRFFEVIAYLYINGNIQIEDLAIDDNKELFLKIRILRNIDSLYGITIDKDKNVFYKGKKVKMRYDSDEFKLIKVLVDFKGRIAKKEFFKLVKWGRDGDVDKNRMNALKGRLLSKLEKCGAKNLKISQACGLIELKEGE